MKIHLQRVLFTVILGVMFTAPQSLLAVNDSLPAVLLDMTLLDAIYEQDSTFVNVLLQKGASANAKDYYDISALMYALQGQNSSIIENLLENGADINAIDHNGTNVLMYSILYGHKDYSLRFLPEVQNINHQDTMGYTALIYAAQNDDLDLVQGLIDAGADISHQTSKGTTAVMHAAAFGSFYVTDLLLYYGADVNHSAKDGSTALHLAAYYGHNEVIGLLLDWGANIERADKVGNTPLMVSIASENIETTWYLLESGASPASINNYGLTPLIIATAGGQTQTVDLLMRYPFAEPQLSEKKISALAYAYFTRNKPLANQLSQISGIKPKGIYISEFWISQGLAKSNDDYSYHAGAGLFEARFKLLLKVNYMRRLIPEKLLVASNGNRHYQFFEIRQGWSVGLSREIPVFSLANQLKGGIMPGLEMIYTYASYIGSGIKPPKGLTWIPSIGFYVHNKNWTYLLSYNYFDTLQADFSVHRVRAGIAYRIPLYRKRSLRYNPVLN